MIIFKRPAQEPIHSRLIAHQNWDAVRQTIATGKGQDELQAEFLELGIDGVLQFVCRFHPPVDVVATLAKGFPGSVTQADSAGRYPLHIACKWGASPQVVRFLAEECPEVARLQDDTGKTPLHHLCLSYTQNYSTTKNGGIPVASAFLEIAKGLCKASPSTVNLEDKDDSTALEYAIFAGVNLKAVRVLQKASEKDWKERRKVSPGLRHEEAQQRLRAECRTTSEVLSRELIEISQSAMERSMSALRVGDVKLPSMHNRLPSVKPRNANTKTAFAA